MSDSDTDLVAWKAATDAFDRILELLQSISNSMSDERDEPVEAVIEQHTALRRSSRGSRSAGAASSCRSNWKSPSLPTYRYTSEASA